MKITALEDMHFHEQMQEIISDFNTEMDKLISRKNK